MKEGESVESFSQTLTRRYDIHRISLQESNTARHCSLAYRKTTAWFSPRPPSLAQALSAKSSTSPIALPSFPPLGPFAEDAYVFNETSAWEDRRAVGRETWKLLVPLASWVWSAGPIGDGLPTG